MADFLTVADAAAQLKEKMEKARLAPAGMYTDPYTGPCRPDCPECGGVGLVRLDVPRHHPAFGKLEPCPNVPVQHRNTVWRHGLTVLEQDTLTWDSFDPLPITIKIGGKAEKTTTDLVAHRMRDYIARRGSGWIWLSSIECWGLAKSMLIKAAVAEALRSGQAAAYIRASELIDDLRLAYDEKHPNENAVERLGKWVSIPTLAVDELEKVHTTDWVMDRLLQLMDRRYELAKDRQSLTLVASNAAPETIDGSLGSRARDGRFLYIELSGKDARPAMTDIDRF